MIYTIEDPVADFVLDEYQGCHPLTVQTITTSLSTNGQYTWEVFVDSAGILVPYGTPIPPTPTPIPTVNPSFYSGVIVIGSETVPDENPRGK